MILRTIFCFCRFLENIDYNDRRYKQISKVILHMSKIMKEDISRQKNKE